MWRSRRTCSRSTVLRVDRADGEPRDAPPGPRVPAGKCSRRYCGALRALAAFLLLLPAADAAPSGAPRDLSFDVALAEEHLGKALRKADVPSEAVGFVVLGSDGAPLWQRHADVPMIVASNNKLVTTAAALSLLGTDHVWETAFGIQGRVVGTTLEGDLWVRGTGDPNISGRDHDGDALFLFRRWAEMLRSSGITRVTGDLVLDDSAFAGERTHPTWLERYREAWFGAESSALELSDGCVSIELVSPGKAGRPVTVATYPDTAYVTLVNSAAAVARRKDDWSISRHPVANIVYISGSLRTGERPDAVWIPVREPTYYFGAVLSEELHRAGVGIDGAVRRGSLEPLALGRRTLDTHTSRLAESVVVTNKRSQNLYAELILKTMGARRSGIGTFATGTAAVADWLGRCVGIGEGYHQVDGSGLSYENRFRPGDLAALLAHMQRTPEGDVLESSLPISGVDGTLRARFSDPELYARIRAKTGFLAGVSGLSGYLETRSGLSLPFSILVNAPDLPKERMEEVEDAILREVFRQLP